MSVKTELKLAYLKDTKNLIKNAIIEKGQDVSDSDTFRSYADKILAIAGGGESDAGVTINLDRLAVVLPITDITVPDDTDGMVPMTQPLGTEAGNIYLIVWNNVGYICKAQAAEFQGVPVIAIGNLAALGGENTGEPFAIGEFPPEVAEQTGGVYGGIIPLDGSTSFSAGGYFIAKAAGGGESSDLVKYVTFMNGSTELYRMPVLNGDDCKNPITTNTISTPTKESTAQYNYTYSGWALSNGGSASTSALTNVTEDRTVYAAYTSTVRSYTITYYDGETVLKTETLAYGSTPSYSPWKDGYRFTDWSPAVSVVTGNAEYYAQWEEVVIVDGGVRVGKTSTSCAPYIPVSTAFDAQGTWTAVTWSGLPNSYTNPGGTTVWTDGSVVYLNNNRVLEKGTTTWNEKTFTVSGTNFNIHIASIWTDGTYVYLSNGSTNHVLDEATSTWSDKTWYGFTGISGSHIWTDGTDIYCSNGSNQYVLDKETSTWSTKTWSGLTKFYGGYIWTDGTDIYYSNGSNQYVLDKETSTWSTKTWSGASKIDGSCVWTDGERIYCSNSTSYQYRLEQETGTWITVSWNGFSNPYNGSCFWTDGANLYFSNGTSQFVLTT